MGKDFIEDKSDDTDSEEVISRIGKIPYQWYDNFNHFGYDIQAQKIKKQQQDLIIDDFIKRNENKDWWRTIKDELNQKQVVLNDEQINVLQRIRSGKFADVKIATNDYSVEYEWSEGMFPLSAAPKGKKCFLPSKYERIAINKLVQAIKLGRFKTQEQPIEENLEDIWQQEQETKNILPPITAPKIDLPKHSESYNPSKEFLFDEEEKLNYQNLDEEDRPINYIPQSHKNLRSVQAYDKLINERFDRCLDLYLCARIKKRRLQMTADQLMPKIPKPQELRPFPTQINIVYEGHNNKINSIAIDFSGQFIASCDQDGFLIIFEVSTSRIQQKIQFDQRCSSIDWNNNGLLLISTGNNIYIISPLCLENSSEIIFENMKKKYIQNDNLQWKFFDIETKEYSQGLRVQINCQDNDIDQVVWHEKGDYFGSLSTKAQKKNEQVFVHSLSKAQSQKPFQKSKGNIQKLLFHNKKPFIFLAIGKKLVSGAQINSCIALHPQGDNIIVGTHDRRVCWFDLDLSTKPYKTFKYHENTVTNVDFHKKYPLFASSSNDGSIHIFHATVYNDLMQNALILPLKILKQNQNSQNAILDIKFHPKQPWIFSAGENNTLICWT